VSISLDNLEAEVQAQGTISRDGVAAGEGQSGRLLFARLDGATGFKPDDFVTVTVLEPALQNVARLPASALDASGTVLVLGTEDRLEAIPVTLLRRQGDDVLITGDGLDGREVVISRTPLLGSGIRVRPVRTDAQSDAQSGAPSMLELSDDHRARLVAFVEGNNRMPSEMKSRVLNQLAQARVPASLVERIESRMGG
ncbi:MAG: efflux transporter periplasmic adaptor subunit, partial [Pseudomonadota bacterium]